MISAMAGAKCHPIGWTNGVAASHVTRHALIIRERMRRSWFWFTSSRRMYVNTLAAASPSHKSKLRKSGISHTTIATTAQKGSVSVLEAMR